MDEALRVLLERYNWLGARIEAKVQVGWDTEWDRRERAALGTVLRHHKVID